MDRAQTLDHCRTCPHYGRHRVARQNRGLKVMIHSAYAHVKRATFGMPFTIILGLSLGAILVPAGTYFADAVAERYDAAFPVLEMTGNLVSASDGEAVISMAGTKNRDCTYIGIRAYSLDKDGNMSDVFIARTDNPTVGSTRPVGTFIIGSWRIWPLPDSKGVTVYASHLCGSRIVITKIAEVPLPHGAPGVGLGK
jgi:hypothetical protein